MTKLAVSAKARNAAIAVPVTKVAPAAANPNKHLLRKIPGLIIKKQGILL